MTAGAPASIAVTATNTTASPAYLNAWFDFNNNGSVADAGEQIATNLLVAAGSNNATITLNLTIPANAVTGASLGTRFRLTNLSSPGVTGNVGLGEVEDHPATIAVPVTDFGDWSGAADASNLASSDLRMGALADAEYLPTKNSAATGDDITASDDEDGVTLSVLMPGTASSAGVVVTNNSGAAGYLNAWIDFNNNGSFADAGEQIATNVAVAHGTNGVSQNIAFNIPVNAIPGIRGARFRLTAAQNPTSFGAGGLGEVEDHMASISCVPFAINPASLPAATVGTAWSQTLTTTGIHSPFIFNVSSGAPACWSGARQRHWRHQRHANEQCAGQFHHHSHGCERVHGHTRLHPDARLSGHQHHAGVAGPGHGGNVLQPDSDRHRRNIALQLVDDHQRCVARRIEPQCQHRRHLRHSHRCG
jgi:hypothetical protein